MTTGARRDIQARVLRLSVALLAGATGLTLILGSFSPTATTMPLPIIFGAFLICGLVPVVIEIGEHNFSGTPTDTALVVGLFAADRRSVVAIGVLAWLITSLRTTRTDWLKTTFNLALRWFEYALAAVAFSFAPGSLDPANPQAWVRACSALILATTVSAALVTVVIGIATGVPKKVVGPNLAASLVVSASSVLVGVVSLILVQRGPSAVLLVAGLALTVGLPYRQLTKVRRKHATLKQIHDFTAVLATAKDLDALLDRAVSHASDSLRCASVVIRLRRPDGSLHSHPTNAASLSSHALDLVHEPIARRTSKGASDFETLAGGAARKDFMLVSLIHDGVLFGTASAADRLGDVSTFDDDDLSIFQTMAHQISVTLHNLDLIDQLREEAAEREYQALHDELTGIPNRSHLYRALDRALSQSASPECAIAICDLNRFKEVNDTLGHHVGDLVLIEAARRLREVTPSRAFVARLGGDEFAILYRDDADTKVLARELTIVHDAFAEPFRVSGMPIYLGVAIGVATAPIDALDRVGLMKAADAAMYAAKAERSDTQLRFFDPSHQKTSARQLALLSDLRTAVANDALEVVYQPKICMRTNAITGVEALARWNHPVHGRISPDEFIPLAENAGLMFMLTEQIMRRSLNFAMSVTKPANQLSVAVNVDAATFANERFLPMVLRLLRETGASASSLVIELTERDVVATHQATIAFMQRLRDAGVKIAIDDFGTGYSSLSYLQRLPLDELKIDRTFVLDVTTSAPSRHIVQAILTLAKALGLGTVVEGVEDAETWETLASLGCDSAQGFLVSPGLSGEDFAAWFWSRSPTASAARW